MAKSEHALRATRIQDLLFRPFIRRQKFLYTGLTDEPHSYALGTLADHDYETKDTDQAVAVLRILDDEHRQAVASWIAEFLNQFDIPADAVGAISLDVWSAKLSKVKWDPSQSLGLERWYDGRIVGPEYLDAKGKLKRDVFFRPVTNYYFYECVRQMAAEPLAVLAGSRPSHNFALAAEAKSNFRELAAPAEVLPERFRELYPSGVRFPLTKGIDLLSVKHLVERKKAPDVPDFHGVALWSASGTAMRYAHIYKSPIAEMAAYRPYSLLFPRLPEPLDIPLL